MDDQLIVIIGQPALTDGANRICCGGQWVVLSHQREMRPAANPTEPAITAAWSCQTIRRFLHAVWLIQIPAAIDATTSKQMPTLLSAFIVLVAASVDSRRC